MRREWWLINEREKKRKEKSLDVTKRDDLNWKHCERNILPHLQLPRIECLKSLFCHFCLQIRLLLIERAQPSMTVCMLILCTSERGHSVFDIHFFQCTVLNIYWIIRPWSCVWELFCWVYYALIINAPSNLL